MWISTTSGRASINMEIGSGRTARAYRAGRSFDHLFRLIEPVRTPSATTGSDQVRLPTNISIRPRACPGTAGIRRSSKGYRRGLQPDVDVDGLHGLAGGQAMLCGRWTRKKMAARAAKQERSGMAARCTSLYLRRPRRVVPLFLFSPGKRRRRVLRDVNVTTGTIAGAHDRRVTPR